MTTSETDKGNNAPIDNACRLCGEPLKATRSTGTTQCRSFAITPAGWVGPLTFAASDPTSRCGLTTTHGGSRLSLGINLAIKDGRIVQNCSGSLTGEQWDQLMGELYLMAGEVGQELPWFESLLADRVRAATARLQENDNGA